MNLRLDSYTKSFHEGTDTIVVKVRINEVDIGEGETCIAVYFRRTVAGKTTISKAFYFKNHADANIAWDTLHLRISDDLEIPTEIRREIPQPGWVRSARLVDFVQQQTCNLYI